MRGIRIRHVGSPTQFEYCSIDDGIGNEICRVYPGPEDTDGECKSQASMVANVLEMGFAYAADRAQRRASPSLPEEL